MKKKLVAVLLTVVLSALTASSAFAADRYGPNGAFETAIPIVNGTWDNGQGYHDDFHTSQDTDFYSFIGTGDDVQEIIFNPLDDQHYFLQVHAQSDIDQGNYQPIEFIQVNNGEVGEVYFYAEPNEKYYIWIAPSMHNTFPTAEYFLFVRHRSQ